MSQPDRVRVYRALATSVVLLAGVWYTGDVLQARGPVWQFAIACGFYAFSAIASKRNSVFSVISSVVFGFIILFAAVWIFITPAPAYSAWFLLVDRGAAQGSVSFVMLLVGWTGIAYLSVVFSRRSSVLLPSIAVWSLFMVAVATQSHTAILLSLCLLIVSMVVSVRLPFRGSVVHGLILALFFAIAMLGGFVSVLRDAPRGSSLIDNLVSPALRSLVLRIRPDFPLLAGFSGGGTGFAEATLSGTPLLSESPVFEISPVSGRTEYIRSIIFDTYSGGSWGSSHSEANGFELLESGVWAPSWMEPHDMDQGRSGVGLIDSSRMGRRSIRVLADYLDVLPYPVDFPLLMISPSEGAQGMRQIFTAGDEYTALALGSRTASANLDSREVSIYTAVPEELADSLTGFVRTDLSDPTRVQNHIRRVLNEESTYSLVRLASPDGTDPLVYFLHENRSGFCVHFASAAVILSRLHGLPARYVTGFLAPSSPQGVPVVVKGVHAHAWAEVWIDGQWRVLETTPGPGSTADPDVALPAETSSDPLTQRQLFAFGLSDWAVDGRSGGMGAAATGGIIIAVFVVLAVAVYALTEYRRNGSYALTSGPHALTYPADTLDTRSARRVRRELRRIASGSGHRHPSKIGWSGWAKAMSELDSAHPTATRRYYTVALIAQNVVFGKREIRRRDVTYLRRVRFGKPT